MLLKEICILNPLNDKPVEKLPFINYLDTSGSENGVITNVSTLTSSYPSRAQRIVNQGDILISSVRPENRHNCFVTSEIPNLVASSGYILVRLKRKTEANARYLYYWLSRASLIDYYAKVADTSQSSFPSFSKETIEDLNICLPSIEEQNHIVDIR